MDDVLTALQTMRMGVRWDSSTKTFTWMPEAQREDINRNLEVVTMENFASMATSLVECLDFTWDCPSRNATGTMAVLDTQMWVGLPAREWGVPNQILPEEEQKPERAGALKPLILFKFYRKEVSNKMPMNARSAAPDKQQIQTATQEFIRRYKNTSRSLPKSHIEEILADYACDLQRGGFTTSWILESMR